MIKFLKKALWVGALPFVATLTIATTASVVTPSSADAASCWWHNGSLMRITATSGGGRTIKYLEPRAVLKRAGVRRGTVLFKGRYDGTAYYGTARRFSKFCVGSPQLYDVSGPANASRITLYGSRDANRRCAPTGRIVDDELVFKFSHAC